jgi:hypothetical protein
MTKKKKKKKISSHIKAKYPNKLPGSDSRLCGRAHVLSGQHVRGSREINSNSDC